MKTLERIFVFLFYAITSFATGISFAQEKSIAQLQAELVSPWLVTVEGEGRTRTLKITGAAQKPNESLLLEAIYGFTDGDQVPIQASASQVGQQSTMQFVTQASAQVVATQTSNGNFEGTFAYKGTTKAVKIERISEDDLKLKVAFVKAARTAKIIVKPAADVPSTCAAFSGVWTGTWPGYGQKWLWVVEVNANCIAKYADVIASAFPNAFQTSEIKGGVLARQKPGGMEYYELHGDELWARYAPTIGRHNTTVYRKSKPSER